jgi:hypothetical protein
MANLVLTPHEREELRLALESYLVDLGSEIRRTDGYEFREALKQRRTVLQEVLGNLDRAPKVSNEVSPA